MRDLSEELGENYAQWMSWNDIEAKAQRYMNERDHLRAKLDTAMDVIAELRIKLQDQNSAYKRSSGRYG